jgi:hypothetical protein
MIPEYPDYRGLGQSAVIRKLLEAGDFGRARKLVDEFTLEPSIRQDALKGIDREQRIANEDTSTEILKEAKELRDGIEEFNYLFRMATEIGTRNPQTTLKLLDRASELLETDSQEKWQMQYQIGIAMRYCQVKSDRCFTMMEPIIRKMNELVSAATKLSGFDINYLRNGEWNMTAEGGVGSLLTMLAKNAVYFAMCDFDRAVALSSQFERREIRMMAQLKLAQGLLDGPLRSRCFRVMSSEPYHAALPLSLRKRFAFPAAHAESLRLCRRGIASIRWFTPAHNRSECSGNSGGKPPFLTCTIFRP